MRSNQNSKQSGQALPVGVALFFLLSATTFVLFNTGQTVTDKTRVVNTADSAAYSGLLWQARAMNFNAYTNRAMVANEVAMAQAVSLHSWSGYMALTGSNLDAALGKVPYLGVVTGIVNTVASSVDTFLTPISQGMLTVINSINVGIGEVQEAMYLATFAATPDVISSVVSSNDIRDQGFKWESGFSILNTALNLNQWRTLTEKFDNGSKEAMHERGHMIRESLDLFSKKRDWRFFNFFIPVTPLNWIRLEKHGTTVLLGNEAGDKWEWQANDALSIRTKSYTWKGKRLSDVPVAGGSSMANNIDSFDSTMGSDHRFHGSRHTKSKKRRHRSKGFSLHDGRQLEGYSGLHAYRSLTTKWRRGDSPPILKLSIEISVNPDNIESSVDVNGESKLTSDIDTPGNVITSVSSAELYFERPCLKNTCIDSEEYADGYSPFWDVRLTRHSQAARLAAYAMHGDTLTDNDHFVPSKVVKLPGYNSASGTPVTDYLEQAEGVERALTGMEHYLSSLEEDSAEFKAYRAQLEEIRSKINFSIGDIIDEFVYEGLTEEDLVRVIAEAAQVDFDVAEYDAIKSAVGDAYEGMVSLSDIASLKEQLGGVISDAAQQLKDDIRLALEEKHKSAIANIMSNLVVGAVKEHTGINLDEAIVEQLAEDAVEVVLNTKVNKSHSSDIEVDLRDECALYDTIHAAELEVEKMQLLMEEANQKIANEFHQELITVTAEAVVQRDAITAEIAVMFDYLSGPFQSRDYKGVFYKNKEEFTARVYEDIRLNEQRIHGLYKKRLEELTRSLMRISDKHMGAIPEFSDFKLNYVFAKQTVKDTLGDITELEIGTDGESVSENLFYAEAENERVSDKTQVYTEKPENC